MRPPPEAWTAEVTDLAACLLRSALILAVHGLMMLSDGDTYFPDLLGPRSSSVPGHASRR